jgi:hypothetical protein
VFGRSARGEKPRPAVGEEAEAEEKEAGGGHQGVFGTRGAVAWLCSERRLQRLSAAAWDLKSQYAWISAGGACRQHGGVVDDALCRALAGGTFFSRVTVTYRGVPLVP